MGRMASAQSSATGSAIAGLGAPGPDEDDLAEMHRRQEDINAHYGCTFADLEAMRWLPRLGEDNVLMNVEGGRSQQTPLFT